MTRCWGERVTVAAAGAAPSSSDDERVVRRVLRDNRFVYITSESERERKEHAPGRVALGAALTRENGKHLDDDAIRDEEVPAEQRGDHHESNEPRDALQQRQQPKDSNVRRLLPSGQKLDFYDKKIFALFCRRRNLILLRNI